MNAPINPRILLDEEGRPEFAVIPIDRYRELVRRAGEEPGVPNEVVHMVFDGGMSPARAWREHLGLTQAELAARMGIAQPTLAEHEKGGRKLRASTLSKLAQALRITVDQLNF